MHEIDKTAIGLRTRQHLARLMGSGDLDEASAQLINAALEKTRPKAYCAWAARLAAALGASPDLAVAAGSFVDVMNTAIDVIDDVEDGDAEAYLVGVAKPVQVNLSVHLAVLALQYAIGLAMLCREAHGAGVRAPEDFVDRVARLFSRAGCGQRLELTRDGWCVPAYVRMTELVGACQFEIYVRAAALAAAVDPEPLARPTAPLSVLFQMTCDDKSNDPRLVQLPHADIRTAREQALAALSAALAQVPAAALPLFRELSASVTRPLGILG